MYLPVLAAPCSRGTADESRSPGGDAPVTRQSGIPTRYRRPRLFGFAALEGCLIGARQSFRPARATFVCGLFWGVVDTCEQA